MDLLQNYFVGYGSTSCIQRSLSPPPEPTFFVSRAITLAVFVHLLSHHTQYYGSLSKTLALPPLPSIPFKWWQKAGLFAACLYLKPELIHPPLGGTLALGGGFVLGGCMYTGQTRIWVPMMAGSIVAVADQSPYISPKVKQVMFWSKATVVSIALWCSGSKVLKALAVAQLAGPLFLRFRPHTPPLTAVKNVDHLDNLSLELDWDALKLQEEALPADWETSLKTKMQTLENDQSSPLEKQAIETLRQAMQENHERAQELKQWCYALITQPPPDFTNPLCCEGLYAMDGDTIGIQRAYAQLKWESLPQEASAGEAVRRYLWHFQHEEVYWMIRPDRSWVAGCGIELDSLVNPDALFSHPQFGWQKDLLASLPPGNPITGNLRRFIMWCKGWDRRLERLSQVDTLVKAITGVASPESILGTSCSEWTKEHFKNIDGADAEKQGTLTPRAIKTLLAEEGILKVRVDPAKPLR